MVGQEEKGRLRFTAAARKTPWRRDDRPMKKGREEEKEESVMRESSGGKRGAEAREGGREGRKEGHMCVTERD